MIKKFIFLLFFGLLLANCHAQAGFFTKTPPPAEIYASDDIAKNYLTAISKANKSILLIMYSLTDPDIIAALNKKCQKIPIEVICDAKASPYIDSKLSPKISVTRRFGPGLMHQKILVIDKKETWIGSANMTKDSLYHDDNLMMSIENVSLAEMIHAKSLTVEVEGRGLAFQHENFNVAGQEIEMWFLPDDKKAVKRLKELMQSAKKTLRVAMYTWTRQDLADEVIAASKRGVTTKVVIDGSSAHGVSKKIVDYLKANGIDTGESPVDHLLHHKFVLIDDKTLVQGSANWTVAAFTHNDDCFVIVNNLTTTQKAKINSVWKPIWKNSKR